MGPHEIEARRLPARRDGLRKLGANLGANLGGDPSGHALFDRTVELVTTMATVPGIRAPVLERLDALGSG